MGVEVIVWVAEPVASRGERVPWLWPRVGLMAGEGTRWRAAVCAVAERCDAEDEGGGFGEAMLAASVLQNLKAEGGNGCRFFLFSDSRWSRCRSGSKSGCVGGERRGRGNQKRPWQGKSSRQHILNSKLGVEEPQGTFVREGARMTKRVEVGEIEVTSSATQFASPWETAVA